ncbi:MAG: ABC transporter substrate-binding protein [Oscillospiraceae bacterium]|nr:ABC transporter substrate-binding protein [Oscillospiraceae bacterium]
MKKRILALALVAILAIGLLAACGGDDPAPAPGNGSGDSPDGLSAVELKFQVIGWGGPGDAEMARLSAAVNAHLSTLNKPYTVDIIFGEGGDYTDRTNLMLASGGNEFDIIFISNWAANFFGNAAAGYLTDLRPYLAKYPEVERILTSDFMNASQVNGVNYALPTNKEKARSMGWVFREDIVEAMGMNLAEIEALPYSERAAALEPWFYKAKEEHNLWIWPNFITTDYQFDRIIEPTINSRVEPGATQAIVADFEPEFMNAVKQNSKWFADGLLNPDLTIQSSGDEEFATGRYFGITYQLKPGKDKELESAIAGDFGFVQLVMNQPEIANSETTGAMLAIPHGATNKDEAFDFISLLYTDKVMINTVIWGTEGHDFEFVGDGVIEFLDGGWSYGHGWTMGDQFKNYLTSAEDPTKWDQFIAFNEAGRPLPLLGFVPDTSDTEMQTWMAGVYAVREMYWDLFQGYYALDQVDAAFDRLRSEYETAGMNELLAKVQEQIDAWLATQ